MLRVDPYADALGAVVTDVNLCEPIGDSLFRELNEALLQYEVLFFRDQPLSPASHARLANLFGSPQVHPAYPHIENYPQLTILENDEATPSKIEMWHTDMTFAANPPLGSILHGIEIPEAGGDTMFSSLTAAYEALSARMKTFLSGLTATHDFSFGFKESLEEPGGAERLASMVRDYPPAAHPVVRTHPLSGKKGLFVNSLFTSRINDLNEKESRLLLDFLFEHMVQDEFTCRFNWHENSVAFWDNRVTLHKPVNDYWPQRRRMQRITIDGDIPV